MKGRLPTVRQARRALRQAIMEWGAAEEGGMKPWREIERAMVALQQAERRAAPGSP